MKQRVSILDRCLHRHPGRWMSFWRIGDILCCCSLTKIDEQSHLLNMAQIKSIGPKGPKWSFRKKDREKRSNVLVLDPISHPWKIPLLSEMLKWSSGIQLPSSPLMSIRGGAISLSYCSVFTASSQSTESSNSPDSNKIEGKWEIKWAEKMRKAKPILCSTLALQTWVGFLTLLLYACKWQYLKITLLLQFCCNYNFIPLKFPCWCNWLLWKSSSLQDGVLKNGT